MQRWVQASLIVGAAAVAMSAAGLFGHAPGVKGDATPAPSASIETAEPKPPFQAVGSAGCAAAACHGGSATNTLTGNFDSHSWSGAATHFLACDPHTKAYEALKSPLANEIMSRMRSPLKATEDVRCLACHTNPALAQDPADNHVRFLREEGVSCEACHGNAQRWEHEHTTWTAANRDLGYQKSGMAKQHDLGDRALACAGCHVGAPADPERGYPVRDMNHDMIAAGHPRLNFDFADYQHRLPPHWWEKERSEEFEVKAWLVGRIAHAEAACRLLADRTDRAEKHDPRTPWPEFAEWNCVSCHHKIEGAFPRKTGTPDWQTIWPITDPLAWVEVNPFRDVPNLKKMSIADPRQVREFAEELRLIRKSAASDQSDLSLRLFPYFLKVLDLETLDRDQAGQVYNGLAARERTLMGREGRTTFDPGFDRLRQSLKEPRGNIDFAVKPDVRAELKKLMSNVK